MTIVDTITGIADWLNTNVCKNIFFKQPPIDARSAIDDNYDYKEVNPVAFPLFVPGKDRLPPNVHSNMPCVCVQLLNGSDSLSQNQRTMSINLGISTWNPGIHQQDIIYPLGTKPEELPKYISGCDGWMDAWNFVDSIIHEIESHSDMNNKIFIDNDTPVTYGMYKEQDQIADFYPMWFAYVQFSVRSDFLRNADYEEFL